MRRLILPAALFVAAATAVLIASRDAMLANAGPSANATADLATDRPPETTGRHLIRREPDGHFWASVIINGASTRMMVDTGATQIVLTKRDAQRAGLDLAGLPKNATITTAGGAVKAHATSLETVSVEGVQVRSVRAVVMEDGLPHSLLGMSYLNRLSGWRVTRDAIVLEP